LDINVPALFTIIGDSFALATNSKQIVGAINEIMAKPSGEANLVISDALSLQEITGAPNSLAVTPYEIGAWKMNVTATGFMCVSSDARFNGVWVDMGANTFGSTNGTPLGTHWYLHESGNFTLTWTNWNANPNVPRAGAWFINNASTPRLDNAALFRFVTANVPLNATAPPPNGAWGTVTMTWTSHTGTEPSLYGFERHFKIHATADDKAFVGEHELLRVDDLKDHIPTPPSSGKFALVAVDGVLQWESV